MRKLVFPVILAGLVTTPIEAADLQGQAMGVRPGAFVGARVRVTLGGKTSARPQAALTLAPTHARTGHDGYSTMRIGEGVAFNLTPGTKPTLTLAGIRADAMLGLDQNGRVDSGQKLGVSTGGWVAIGLGVVALAGGVYVLHVLKEADENSD